MSDVFATIVCGVDGSDAGVEAVRQARRLATPDSRIVVGAVSETHLAVHTGMLAGQATDELDAEAQSALEAVGDGVETRLIRGRAEETLLRIALEERATLVAVGSHETTRRRGILLGSVATRMLHDAPCSVLLARPAEAGFPRSIVVGVDGSPPSLEAAGIARDLGAQFGGHVTVLAARGANEDELDLDALVSSSLELRHADEKPVPALLAASRNADLLVVASRGLRGVRALGSVSERTAHEAHCSVLVYRPPSAV